MEFFNNYTGELIALLTAFLWAVTAMFFEAAGKKIGSLVVNLLRLLMAFVFLSAYNWFLRGALFPTDATQFQWFWLAISGIVGFVIGDLFLFQAYVLIGARISMLIMALAPLFSALTAWIILGESMSSTSIFGMILTFSGIAMVVLNKQAKKEGEKSKFFHFALKHSPIGLLCALGGAFGQGVGLVLSKYGMQDFDPFASSQIRILAGITGFVIIFTVSGKWGRLKKALTETKAMFLTLGGSFFGPFLGVSFSLMAVSLTSAGIAASIMSIVPVIIIVPAVFVFKEKVALKEVIGALVSTVGVILFFV
ncbi:MAG: DMT family transporter [Salinivirgaceae bacterium]|nr:DMT family transporter [Salinivirgaceae bacterium]MDD4747830.1 DMT family transporter [Salinivirgaceae bacterium]MDY0281558.1 DMT family transporter [Salinivirgaceae bacterium]